MVLRRFWKQHFSRKGSISGVFAFGPSVSGAAGVIYSRVGKEEGNPFAYGRRQVVGPGDANLHHPP